MSDRKCTCPITGQSLLFGKDYWDKKVKEFGSEDNLRSFYVARKCKTLLARGFTVTEIRKLLSIVDDSLPNEADLAHICEYYSKKKTSQMRRFESSLNFNQQTTDEDVKIFLNTIRKQGYE
jgi:DNA-binding transcriptional MerR regulator